MSTLTIVVGAMTATISAATSVTIIIATSTAALALTWSHAFNSF
jgi:hypothetical protein